jgi:SAM-dependent methyltransferase
MPSRDEAMLAFYTSREDEAGRLGLLRNGLEFVRTQELLRARLPAAPARILDVGGGTGAHAAWLAADGHDVHLVDVVPDHVREATNVARALAHGFTAAVGDARALDAGDASTDVCLLLGPLYHLPDAPDRAAALQEACRVTRPGGLVAAAAISRFAWPMYELRNGNSPCDDAAAFAGTLATGCGDPLGNLPSAFSHRPQQLADEMAAAGLVDIEVLGIEGPGWVLFARSLTEERAASLVTAAACAARLYDGYAEMAAASAHLLAFGRRP